MAYNTPESVADYLSRFQMQVTERTKGTFSPMHVKYSLALKMGSSSFETTFQSNPNVHGEPTDDAKDTIMGAVSAAFEDRYGEDFAEVATDFGQDIDDIAGRANPCILSVDTVRAVNEKGYDAVFAEQWKTELSECDIDPEAVSVDSEAHDMENGRDGLDGNAPEKDAPEKDDRDAQPPVDTDNR